MQKQIMTGDEAVARGIWEAGAKYAAAYPGTPSTEILENVAQYRDDIYSQWACNEKVALEMASGAAIVGSRSLAAMKHVGLNVAADPLFTMSYTGVNAGLVVVTADDPGSHSSQNEQDNRHYAVASKIPMLEPSGSQECLDMIKRAYEISEEFDTPVLFRMTTRICHSKGVVALGERVLPAQKMYERNPGKYAMLPAAARVRHAEKEKMLIRLEEYANTCGLNYVVRPDYYEGAGESYGVIASGAGYQYAREAFDGETIKNVEFLKLGMTNPMPNALIKEFAAKHDVICIVEEGDAFIENAAKRLGIECRGKFWGDNPISLLGELDANSVRAAFIGGVTVSGYTTGTPAPVRAPMLCAGCPHRGFFYTLRQYRSKLVPFGDIGCYSLGVAAPLEGFDTVICMGGGFSVPVGASRALVQQGDDRKLFGMMGDSTFFHSGLTGLVDIIHSEANVCACILDNSITAMTGHQENPGTPKDLMGYQVPAMNIDRIVLSMGLPTDRLRVVDPVDMEETGAAIEAALAVDGPFVIIARRPCALLKDVIAQNGSKHCEIDAGKCVGCKACTKIACPSIAFDDGKARIADAESCTGCTLCVQQCKFGAISVVE